MSKDNYIFMNYGYADLNQHGYPLSPKNLLPLHSEWYYQANLYIYLLSLIKPTYKDNILDIGCGNGGGTSVYQEYYDFNKVVGIDINKDYIDFCKNSYPKIKFLEQNILYNNLPNNFFNIITGIQIIESFNNSFNTLNLLFQQLKRILSLKGTLLLTIHQYNNNIDGFLILKKALKNNNLNILKEIDISKNVSSALNIDLHKHHNQNLYNITRKAYKDMLHSTYKIFVITNS